MQNQPQQFDSFREFMQSQIEIHERLAINYPGFQNSYDNIQSFQQQYSNALTIENQIQIFSNRYKNDITKNITIVEEDVPIAVPQVADDEEDEEEQQTNMAVVQLKEKLWGTVIPEQRGKLLFWSGHKFRTVGVIVADNEFIHVDQQFIQAYKGDLIKRQIVRKFNEALHNFDEVVQTHSKLKGKVSVYLIITEDTVPFKRMQETIKNCSDTHKVISQIIRGKPDEATAQVQYNHIQKLNPAQNLACLKALQKNVTLIQGCPGGGKTTTSAYIIKTAMPKHKKILVCAGTNVAADNLCMALKKIGIMSTRVCAVSREQNYVADKKYTARVHPDIMDREIHMQCLKQLQPVLDELTQNLKDYKLECPDDRFYEQFYDVDTGFGKNDFDIFKRYFIQPPKINFISSFPSRQPTNKAFDLYRITYSEIFQESQIIVSTCANSGDRRFQNKKGYTKFDLCLLDESSQAIEPEQLIPIVHGSKKLVLVGDQKQLGPSIQSQNLKKAGFGLSLFQRLVNCNFPVTPLNIQYRMHPALIEYPNKRYYDGIINSGVEASNRLLQLRETKTQLVPDHFPSQMINVQNGHEEQSSQSTSYFNKKECEETITLVGKLLKTYHITEEDIGIITPYGGQKHLIRNKLKEKNITNVEISSVDEFQGREKKIIILSFVRSIRSGFTNNVQRLNVSLTRAQYQLYIICNVKCLYKDRELKELVKFYEQKKAIVNHQ
ncbi:DNA_helicase [Hexamita inflata]|uniref:Putative n=1 Tax=Hexamita inflata TaxID=28002 RepID=A0AA86ULT2_9EUKA|nr:DNA helicase [Hexamita inflata]CAI9956337.1 DNA helicase [Hexamita inflata]